MTPSSTDFVDNFSGKHLLDHRRRVSRFARGTGFTGVVTLATLGGFDRLNLHRYNVFSIH
ncbi:MAG: hypothetical protein R3F37_19590 [Candidatus Competibacteraceae bacterium]